MTNRTFITKRADPDSHQRLDIGFKAASREEIRKEMGLENLNDLPDGFIAGWASTKELDHYRHVVNAGAFDDSIRQKGLRGPKGIKLLIQHKADKPAGVINKLETRGGGLWMEAQLNLKIGYVRDYYEAAKMNGGLSFSVGFYLEEYTWKKAADGGEYLDITKGELEEVSVVTFPGNADAIMTFVKDRDGSDADDEEFETLAALEKALVASGVVKSRNMASRVTRVVKQNLALFQAGAAEPPAPEPEPLLAKDKVDALYTLAGDLRSLFKTT